MRFKLFLIFFMSLTLTEAGAHHGFALEFDKDKPVVLKGKITKVEFINPHSWIHIKVEEAGKPAQIWAFEAGTPNTLFRAGVTKASLKVGTEITARGYQSIDGVCKPVCRANGRELKLPGGENIFIKKDSEAAEGPLGEAPKK